MADTEGVWVSVLDAVVEGVVVLVIVDEIVFVIDIVREGV